MSRRRSICRPHRLLTTIASINIRKKSIVKSFVQTIGGSILEAAYNLFRVENTLLHFHARGGVEGVVGESDEELVATSVN